MRDIEFRGKALGGGEWVYGGIVHQTDFYGNPVDRYFIIDGTTTQDYDIGPEAKVDPETVGQYTGITDKNGRKIYEGDILEGLNGAARMVVFFAEITGYGYGFQWRPVKGGGLFESMTGFADEYAVIGNIHDNPELLAP